MVANFGNAWVALLLSVLFFCNTIYLIEQTATNQVDMVETFRYFLYFLVPIVYCSLSRKVVEILLYIAFLLTSLHLVLAIYAQSLFGYDFLTVDGRLLFVFVDRSPGATAQALLVLLIFLSFRLPPFNFVSDLKLRLCFSVLLLYLIFMTESRAYSVAALLISLPLIKDSMKSLEGLASLTKKFWTQGLGIALAALFIYPSVEKMFNKFYISVDFTTGRLSLWNVFFEDLMSRKQMAILFGDGLYRKTIIASDINYNTSDIHNHFLDPVNYYGLVLPCVFFIWYCIRAGVFRHGASAFFIISMTPILFTTSIFKYSFVVYTSAILCVIPLYIADRLMEPEKQ